MIIILCKFHPESDGKNHPVRDDSFFIQKMMTSYIQQWMIIVSYKFHPENDDIKHPIMEETGHIQYWMNKIIQYWMIIGDVSLSIERAM